MQRYCPIPVVDFPFTSINFQKASVLDSEESLVSAKLRRNQVALR